MRIASLQPSITLTLHAVGAIDQVCACTKHCLRALPELKARKLPLLEDSWSFDRQPNLDALLAARPDLVLASVPYRIESLAAILKSGLPLLALAPRSLADIYADIRLIASVAHAVEAGEQLILTMQRTLAATEALRTCRSQADRSQTGRSQTGRSQPDRSQTDRPQQARPLVYCEEWGKPLIHSQLWVAELVTAAGGQYLGTPGAHTTAETIAAADPDVLLFAWCGAGDRVPLARVIEQRGWHGLRAVRSGRVHCIPDEFLNTPAPALLEGLACIAAATHPGLYPPHPAMLSLTVADRERLQTKCPSQ